MTMRPSAARMDVSALPDRASSTWNATSISASAKTSAATLRLRQFRPCYHLARDQRSEDSEERCVRDGGRGTADPCGCEDGDPARGPEGGERRKRPAGDWQPASPVRDRCQEEARDDGARIAENHLVRVPVHS